jgi:hypothetical protein
MINFLAKTDKSVFVELWEYLADTYLSPELPYMENISFGTGTLITLKTILWGITIGVIAASFITIYNKRYIGGFIRKVIEDQCLSPDGAKTLEELGYINHIAVRNAIRSGGTLSRWVRCVEEDEFLSAQEIKRAEFEEAHKNDKKVPKFKEVEFKRDFKTMHFYIPADRKEMAEIKFDPKGANLWSIILVCVISVLLCAGLSFALPELMKMMDNFISVMNG